jgi:cobalt-zinc-cadmium efflux system membrane fusion protein
MKTLIGFLLASTLMIGGCSGKPEAESAQAHDHPHQGPADAGSDFARGPHRGRLLVDGNFAVEVTIFEQGVPPEFRVYAYRDNAPVAPAEVSLSIELARLGGGVDRFDFEPQEDFLRGNGVVEEPHSFDVAVSAAESGRTHLWKYASYEGRTTIANAQAASAGIETAVAGPGVLRETVTLYGRIRPDPERVRAVAARFPGIIRSVRKQIGDQVKAGETVATVESNESLQTYAVASPLTGRVTERHANAGESTGAEPLLVVADFSTVWADLALFPRDRPRLAIDQPVIVTAADVDVRAEGRIALIAPPETPGTQNLIARVVLPNPQGLWTPGLFVTGEVLVESLMADLVVPVAALQSFRDFTVVYARVGNTYEVRMLELGRSDGEHVEVLGGLDPGTTYVTTNSYLIKADIEKSGASHDH